jgi:hypothetical protein
LNSVAEKPSPFLTPIFMPKGVLIFPITITLAWDPSSVIFTSSIFLGIPKLSNDSKSLFFFLVYAIESFFENQ